MKEADLSAPTLAERIEALESDVFVLRTALELTLTTLPNNRAVSTVLSNFADRISARSKAHPGSQDALRAAVKRFDPQTVRRVGSIREP